MEKQIKSDSVENVDGIAQATVVDSYFFGTPLELETAIKIAVKETDVVLDIGCGIAPMNYFRPKLHLMVEPWKEYSDILTHRYSGDKSILIIRTGALEALRELADNSVDSIFLLDVIEHLEKEIGQQVIIETERVAREQIVIFTPLGFMPQHVESGEVDGWGLGGNGVQEHLSGWEPEDFGREWSFYICEGFHSVDFKNDPLEQTYGAFYAIRNFNEKATYVPGKISDFRRLLPSEVEAQKLREELQQIMYDKEVIQNNYNSLYNSRGVRLINSFKKLLAFIGITRYK